MIKKYKNFHFSNFQHPASGFRPPASSLRLPASSLRPPASGFQLPASGFIVIGAIVTVLLLGAIGAGMTYLISSGQQTRIQQVTSDQAYYLNQAGMEYGLGKVLQEGSGSTSFTKKFMGETITVNRSGGTMTVNSARVNARETHSITDPNAVDPSTCLVANVSGATVSGTTLSGIILTRDPSCTLPLTINAMTGATSWTPNLGELLTGISIGGTTNYNNPAGAVMGSEFTFTANTIINDSNNYSVSITWKAGANMTAHDFNLVFQFSYNDLNHPLAVPVSFLNTNQASCFSWNTAGAVLAFTPGTMWQQLTGTTISNSCALPIRLKSMAVAWSPSSTGNFSIFQVGGNNIFSGSSSSGTAFNIDYAVTTGAAQTVNFLQFDKDMVGQGYSIVWTFLDDTQVTTPLTIFNSNENNCLTVDTTNLAFSTTDITGLKVQNTCAADIGITGITVSWSGDTAKRFTRLEQWDGRAAVNVYAGTFASGALMTLTSAGPTYGNLYYIDGGGQKNIDRIRFSTNLVLATTYTITFTMADGTTKATPITMGQVNCLIFDTATAAQSGTYLINTTVRNNCGSPIVWSTTTVSWTPVSPVRTLSQIWVNGSRIFNGTAANGAVANNSDLIIPASTTRAVNSWRFNSTMAGTSRTFTIRFTMTDASTKTFTFGPLP